MNVDELLKTVSEAKASDLHLKVGNVAHMRVDGELRPVPGCRSMSYEDVETVASSVMNERQREQFQKASQVDFAYSVSGVGRFRVNVYRQRGTIAMALRVIPEIVDSLAQLQLPKVVETLADERRGLVLVTGVAGSGKSTTLAAMIDRVNATRPAHIVTLEDPIEFLHRDKMSMVDQREVGEDIPDFKSGLRAVLRQDPDVILVGEMRDLDTIQTVLVAAETGHTVFSTLHTLDAAETIQRVIAVFEPHDQQQARLQLAATLKGVAALRLLKRKGAEGRVPAVEVLVTTNYIRDCIINSDKTPLIRQAIAAGHSQYGMQTFDQSLFNLYTEGFIELEDALPQASKPDEFRLRVAGIHSD